VTPAQAAGLPVCSLLEPGRDLDVAALTACFFGGSTAQGLAEGAWAGFLCGPMTIRALVFLGVAHDGGWNHAAINTPTAMPTTKTITAIIVRNGANVSSSSVMAASPSRTRPFSIAFVKHASQRVRQGAPQAGSPQGLTAWRLCSSPGRSCRQPATI
jgi:hypothetical protein